MLLFRNLFVILRLQGLIKIYKLLKISSKKSLFKYLLSLIVLVNFFVSSARLIFFNEFSLQSIKTELVISESKVVKSVSFYRNKPVNTSKVQSQLRQAAITLQTAILAFNQQCNTQFKSSTTTSITIKSLFQISSFPLQLIPEQPKPQIV